MTTIGPLDIDLIVPARDEQANIGALLGALPTGLLRHVVVVNNGSADQTAELARTGGAIVVDEPRRGYGWACLAGLDWIKSQASPPIAVAFMDADLSDKPEQLRHLCEPIRRGKADLVLGSRTAKADPGALTPHQRLGNQLACILLRWTTGRHYGDLPPMRVINWKCLQALQMSDQTWGWTVEMQFKAACAGVKILEIDVPYRPRHAGRSKISGSAWGSVRAGWKILITIMGLWISTRRSQWISDEVSA